MRFTSFTVDIQLYSYSYSYIVDIFVVQNTVKYEIKNHITNSNVFDRFCPQHKTGEF